MEPQILGLFYRGMPDWFYRMVAKRTPPDGECSVADPYTGQLELDEGDSAERYHDCPLCGDAGWPEGAECRYVKQARAEGRLP